MPEIPTDLQGTCTGWTIEYEEGYPTENVLVNAPAGTVVTIKAPTSHVVVTGTSYANIIASTDYNTLVIPDTVSVTNLTVKKGSVEIHGAVTNLTVSPEPGMNVYFRKCENLIQSVFDKIKGEGFNFIDPAYVEKQNGNKWDIVLKDEPMGFSQGEFSTNDSKKVLFTSGNLSSDGNSASIGGNEQSDSQSFFWSESLATSSAASYSDAGASAKDSLFTEKTDFTVGEQSGIWHTLSADDWKSLFENYNSRWSKVNGKDGIVIASSKTGDIKDSYSEQEWEQAESKGYIFLPVTGQDEEGKDEILYWSSTPDSSDKDNAKCVYMKKPEPSEEQSINAETIIDSKPKSSKGAIRLVTYTENPNVGIEIEAFNDKGNL